MQRVTIYWLADRKHILNISGLARAAGIKPATLRKYVNEATELQPHQVTLIEAALREIGLVLVP